MALNKEIEICQKISSEVKNTFLQVYNAVKERETQLLRQIEVLAQHCKLNDSYEKCFKQISIIFDNEVDILLSISKFGRINFNGLSHDSNFFKIEDYQHPDKDHVSLFKRVENDYKECQTNIAELKTKLEDKTENESNKNDFVDNNIDEYSTKTTNVMLECIEKQDPSLCLYEISECDKRKLKLIENNQKVGYEEHFSSCCSSPNEIHLTSKYCNTINDLQKDECVSVQGITSSTSVPNLNCICGDDAMLIDGNYCLHKGKHFKDNTNSAEELRIVSDRVRKLSMKQPVQVQQWMKQIISEPETEPAPNNVMEHSQIKVFHKENL